MRRIRLDCSELRPAGIIEGMDPGGIAAIGIWRTDVFNPMAFPKTVRSAEGRKAALGRHSRTRQNDDVIDVIANHSDDPGNFVHSLT